MNRQQKAGRSGFFTNQGNDVAGLVKVSTTCLCRSVKRLGSLRTGVSEEKRLDLDSAVGPHTFNHLETDESE